ncbi:MAG: hypothetical protein Q7I97_01635 [Thermovirgaceae bacterium]|nr:hypothetical protein [Thermovirgaceae bacterium]
MGKLAIDRGLWYLAEYENEEFVLNRKPKEFSPIEVYLKKQARFKHLKEKEIKFISANRDKRREKILKKWKV